jgi:hypothetical protein
VLVSIQSFLFNAATDPTIFEQYSCAIVTVINPQNVHASSHAFSCPLKPEYRQLFTLSAGNCLSDTVLSQVGEEIAELVEEIVLIEMPRATGAGVGL